MMATIRTGARIFKAASQQILETKQKTTETVKKICSIGVSLARRLKKCIRSFFVYFTKKKHKHERPILIQREPVRENKVETKKSRTKKVHAKKKVDQKNANENH